MLAFRRDCLDLRALFRLLVILFAFFLPEWPDVKAA
jgi:hypothetical protein